MDGLEVHLARFKGSFFAVRFAVEDLVAVDMPDPLLIYLPGAERDPKSSVLMELEKAGTTYEPQLKRLARNVLRQVYTDGDIDEMLKPEALGYQDVVAYLRQAESGGQASILKTIFGEAGSEAILVQWLADANHDRAIADKEATGELYRLVEAGWALRWHPQWRSPRRGPGCCATCSSTSSAPTSRASPPLRSAWCRHLL